MKTNGVVGNVAVALAICLSASCLLADELQPMEDSIARLAPPYEETAEVACGQNELGYPQPAFWFGGVEAVFMNVNASTGGRITLSYSDTTAPGVATTAFRDGENVGDVGFAPRLWFGRQFGENWAARITYFSIASEERRLPKRNPAIPTTGTNFATFTSWGDAEMSSVDLDLVRSWNWSDNFKLDLFGGARYSSFDVTSGLDTFGVFTTGNFVNVNLQNNSNFNGLGPSLGFSSRSRLGDSGLFFLWNGRGSILFGEADGYARSVGTVSSSPSAPLVGAAPVPRSDIPSSLGIIESQVGFQYEFEYDGLPFNYFIKTAFEFQHWNINNKVVPAGAGFGGTIGELTTNSFASAANGGATMIGLSIATGFTW